MKDLRITFHLEKGETINTEFEKELDQLIEKYGLSRWASGYNPKTEIRDIAFDVPEVATNQEQP